MATKEEEKLKKNQTCVFDNFPQSGAVSVEM